MLFPKIQRNCRVVVFTPVSVALWAVDVFVTLSSLSTRGTHRIYYFPYLVIIIKLSLSLLFTASYNLKQYLLLLCLPVKILSLIVVPFIPLYLP
jgi:hypothetical protein